MTLTTGGILPAISAVLTAAFGGVHEAAPFPARQSDLGWHLIACAWAFKSLGTMFESFARKGCDALNG